MRSLSSSLPVTANWELGDTDKFSVRGICPSKRRSHLPVSRLRANEKGNVERLLGYARRNFLVPVPDVGSLESLNETLVERCRADLQHHTRGKPGMKEERLVEDRAAFLSLPKQPFEARKIDQAAADSQSLVRFDCNSYSVPVKYAHRQITIVASVE